MNFLKFFVVLRTLTERVIIRKLKKSWKRWTFPADSTESGQPTGKLLRDSRQFSYFNPLLVYWIAESDEVCFDPACYPARVFYSPDTTERLFFRARIIKPTMFKIVFSRVKPMKRRVIEIFVKRNVCVLWYFDIKRSKNFYAYLVLR